MKNVFQKCPFYIDFHKINRVHREYICLPTASVLCDLDYISRVELRILTMIGHSKYSFSRYSKFFKKAAIETAEKLESFSVNFIDILTYLLTTREYYEEARDVLIAARNPKFMDMLETLLQGGDILNNYPATVILGRLKIFDGEVLNELFLCLQDNWNEHLALDALSLIIDYGRNDPETVSRYINDSPNSGYITEFLNLALLYISLKLKLSNKITENLTKEYIGTLVRFLGIGSKLHIMSILVDVLVAFGELNAERNNVVKSA